MKKKFRSLATLLACLPVFILLHPAQLCAGTLRGVVTGPLPTDVRVEISYWMTNGTWSASGSITPDTGGEYSYTQTNSAHFRLFARSLNAAYASEWHADAYCEDDASPIYIPLNTTSTVNVALLPASSIYGTVTMPPGFGYSPTQFIILATTRLCGSTWHPGGSYRILPDGSFSITNLVPGIHRLYIDSLYPDILSVWYNDQSDPTFATHILVPPSGSVTGVVIGLSRPSTISGHVYEWDFGWVGAIGAGVMAYRWDGDSWEEAGLALADFDGGYTISVQRTLLGGTYAILFTDGGFGVWDDLWYTGASSLQTATPISVPKNGDVHGIDDYLQPFSGGSPEIDVRGNGVSIPSGSQNPQLSNRTDFGPVSIGANTTQYFTIHNLGSAPLKMSGNPIVAFSTSGSPAFGSPSNPPISIASGNSALLPIRFAPLSVGVHTAVVTIATDDADEQSYTYAIRGEAIVELNSSVASNGLALFWPKYGTESSILFQASLLASNVEWTATDTPPTPSASNRTVELPAPEAVKFFTIGKP